MNESEQLQICTRCKTEKSIKDFSKSRSSLCKMCSNIASKKSKLKLKEKEKIIIENQICNTCKINKNIYEFGICNRNITGFDKKCKLCLKKYQNEHIVAKRLNNKKRRNSKLDWLNEIKKDKPCTDCGKIYEPFCMEYDHLKDKNTEIAALVHGDCSKKRILNEISKCELCCLFCHARRTHNRRPENKKRWPNVLVKIEIINKAKNKPCEICGLQYESFNMHFDHISQMSKRKNISDLRGYKIETILEEIALCRVICALCHRRISVEAQKANKNPNSRLKNILNNERPKVAFRQKMFVDEINKIKECTKCHQHLPFNRFSLRDKIKNKYDPMCKACIEQNRKERINKKNSPAATE